MQFGELVSTTIIKTLLCAPASALALPAIHVVRVYGVYVQCMYGGTSSAVQRERKSKQKQLQGIKLSLRESPSSQIIVSAPERKAKL